LESRKEPPHIQVQRKSILSQVCHNGHGPFSHTIGPILSALRCSAPSCSLPHSPPHLKYKWRHAWVLHGPEGCAVVSLNRYKWWPRKAATLAQPLHVLVNSPCPQWFCQGKQAQASWSRFVKIIEYILQTDPLKIHGNACVCLPHMPIAAKLSNMEIACRYRSMNLVLNYCLWQRALCAQICTQKPTNKH